MNETFNILENDNFHLLIFAVLGIILFFLLQKTIKVFLFFYYIFIGRFGEEKAKKLLKKNGYKILKKQFTIKCKLLENNAEQHFILKPDYLVKKNNVSYIAEVKTGKSANIINRNTRRQLLEYLVNYKSETILLIDVRKEKITTIKFLHSNLSKRSLNT